MDNKKVLIGVSGGVDSSVAVDILKKQGYEVFGAVINFSECSATAIEDAQKVCAHLCIPICVIDASKSFEDNVITPFCQSYLEGKTPNPCVVCNPLVKFASLCKKADEMGIYYVATGHYARVEKIDEYFYVKKALGIAKDQSYMLYRLGQDILKRLVLPLGDYEKSDIRTKAKDIGLFNFDKPDSQEICFIPTDGHANFIEQRGYRAKKGFFISPDGKKLSPHLGVHHYTIGQRKGLNIALGKPAFIKEICENGDILLGFSGEEFFVDVTLDSVVFAQGSPLKIGAEYPVKVRSGAKTDVAQITFCDEKTIVLHFDTPVRAAAKGQSVVIYDDDYVIGGGFITAATLKKQGE